LAAPGIRAVMVTITGIALAHAFFRVKMFFYTDIALSLVKIQSVYFKVQNSVNYANCSHFFKE